jgi:hypothetical protein
MLGLMSSHIFVAEHLVFMKSVQRSRLVKHEEASSQFISRLFKYNIHHAPTGVFSFFEDIVYHPAEIDQRKTL